MKIKITIEGPKGSGKTTIARFVEAIIRPLVRIYNWDNEVAVIDDGGVIDQTTADHNHVVIVTRTTEKVNTK